MFPIVFAVTKCNDERLSLELLKLPAQPALIRVADPHHTSAGTPAQTLVQLKSKSAHSELSCAWFIGQLFTKNQSVDVDLQNDENLFFCNKEVREHQNSKFQFGFNVGYITLTCSSPPVPLRAPQPGLSIRGVIWILASCQTPPIFTNTETAI